jgi:hypothetical protein
VCETVLKFVQFENIKGRRTLETESWVRKDLEKNHATPSGVLFYHADAQLFVALALTGACLFGTTPASAAVISFSEATAPITITTDIVGATTTTSNESASLSLGTVTGTSTLLFRRQMVNQGAMTGEGGGNGVSDILELDSFVSGTTTVGFRNVSFLTLTRSPRWACPPWETSLTLRLMGIFSKLELYSF